MRTSQAQLSRVHHVALAALVLGALFTASIALADIVSGTYATGKSNDVTITQLTISKPASVAAGDLLLANIAINGGSAAVVTAPAGWTQVLRTDNDTNISLISFSKIAGASEPSNYTWSIDHQTTAEGGITRYTGVDASNPIDTAAGNTGYGTTATTSSITTADANEMVISFFAADVGKSTDAGNYFSQVTGMTEKFDISNTPFGPSTAADDVIQTASGASGSKSSTITGNKARNWATQQIALRKMPPLTFTEDFNSYSDGPLSGQNGGSGWSGAWSNPSNGDTNNYLVQGSVVYDGGKAIYSSNSNGNISRSIGTPATSGIVTVAMRRNTNSSGLARTLLEAGATTQYAVELASTGNIVLKSTAGDVDIQPYSPDTWYSIDIQFDTTVPQYRVRVNGGSWTAWKAPFDGSGTSAIDKIYFDEFDPNTPAATNYWDTLSRPCGRI